MDYSLKFLNKISAVEQVETLAKFEDFNVQMLSSPLHTSVEGKGLASEPRVSFVHSNSEFYLLSISKFNYEFKAMYLGHSF